MQLKGDKRDKGPGTPYSLRRTKQPPTRYGADSTENLKLNTHVSPKSQTKHATSSNSNNNNNSRSRSSSKERDGYSQDEDERDESEKRAYSLRPRSQISYKVPSNI